MTQQLWPMLATPAAPFDDAAYHFAIKWDGIRAMAAVAGGRWQLWGRRGTDYTARYPELAGLGRLPSGTVLDGELVVLQGGRADFAALLRRHQRRLLDGLGGAAGCQPPVCYVVFDLLYAQGRALVQTPLVERQARLQALHETLAEPVLACTEGVRGAGRAYFAQVVALGHEGVVAKRLDSPYQPGQRSAAWRKLKPAGMLPGVVVGYRVDRHGRLRVLVATVHDGVLRYAGALRLGSAASAALVQRLATRRRSEPLVACPARACWVEPAWSCRVHHHGWTPQGRLRHAVFAGWIPDPDVAAKPLAGSPQGSKILPE